ncbi:MAG: hypothetical protein AAF213_05165 [Pseudomonadota bacterium]
MGKKSKKKPFDGWSYNKRWKRAGCIADRLIDHICDLIHINASNEWVVYGALAKRIPRSYAANAFNRFRHAAHHYELIRLTAMWDAPRDDRVSFPTIIALLDFPEVTDLLRSSVFEHWAGPDASANEEPINALRRIILERAKEKRDEAPDNLKKLSKLCTDIAASDELKALREFRNNYIAHNLDFSEVDDRAKQKPKYKDETNLLQASIPIADGFHQLLNGSSFGFDSAQEHAKKNSEELWGKADFNIVDRSKKPKKSDT